MAITFFTALVAIILLLPLPAINGAGGGHAFSSSSSMNNHLEPFVPQTFQRRCQTLNYFDRKSPKTASTSTLIYVGQSSALKNCYFICPSDWRSWNPNVLVTYYCCSPGFRLDVHRGLCLRFMGIAHDGRQFSRYSNRPSWAPMAIATKTKPPVKSPTKALSSNTVPRIMLPGKSRVCPEGLSKPHPNDCHRYYRCMFNHKYVEMRCPFGWQWNPHHSLCDPGYRCPSSSRGLRRHTGNTKGYPTYPLFAPVFESTKIKQRTPNKIQKSFPETPTNNHVISHPSTSNCYNNKWQRKFFRKNFGLDCLPTSGISYQYQPNGSSDSSYLKSYPKKIWPIKETSGDGDRKTIRKKFWEMRPPVKQPPVTTTTTTTTTVKPETPRRRLTTKTTTTTTTTRKPVFNPKRLPSSRATTPRTTSTRPSTTTTDLLTAETTAITLEPTTAVATETAATTESVDLVFPETTATTAQMTTIQTTTTEVTTSPPTTTEAFEELLTPAKMVNITTPPTTRAPMVFDEDSRCYEPTARYKDVDDCQCFYECQINYRLTRNCCPEGMFFNQIDYEPSTATNMSHEMAAGEGMDAYCDISDNIPCQSSIQ